MGHAYQNYANEAAECQFACPGHHTLTILLGRLSKPGSHSVLGECKEKKKTPWSIKHISHDSKKMLWPENHLVYLKIPLSYHCVRI